MNNLFSRSRKCRPVSAPPGKFDLASLAKSLKDQAGPDSPRLSGVVEKEESVGKSKKIFKIKFFFGHSR